MTNAQRPMTDDEIRDAASELRWDTGEGNLSPEAWQIEVEQLCDAIGVRRSELVQLLKRTPEPGNRTSLMEQLIEHRRLTDELREAQHARATRAAEYRQQRSQREQIEASNHLAAAGYEQARALTFWTRWLAIATVVLAVATVALVVFTAATPR